MANIKYWEKRCVVVVAACPLKNESFRWQQNENMVVSERPASRTAESGDPKVTIPYSSPPLLEFTLAASSLASSISSSSVL